MALPYLTLATFKARSLIAPGEVDYVEQDSPGFVAARIAIRTSWTHQRLRKRYGKSLPFGDPVPEILLGWLTALVSLDVMRRRGINPQDPQAEMLVKDFETAEAEIKEAADSENGLFDLPSVETGGSAVSTGGPLGYSETSPYAWMTKERIAGRIEDKQGDGTGDD